MDFTDEIDSLGRVMSALDKIKKEQAVIEMKFGPMFEQYNLLERFIPGKMNDKEELDRKSSLTRDWKELIQVAEDKQTEL